MVETKKKGKNKNINKNKKNNGPGIKGKRAENCVDFAAFLLASPPPPLPPPPDAYLLCAPAWRLCLHGVYVMRIRNANMSSGRRVLALHLGMYVCIPSPPPPCGQFNHFIAPRNRFGADRLEVGLDRLPRPTGSGDVCSFWSRTMWGGGRP